MDIAGLAAFTIFVSRKYIYVMEQNPLLFVYKIIYINRHTALYYFMWMLLR